MELWPKDDDAKRKYCAEKGIDPTNHCCLAMAYAISKPLLTPHQGENRVIDWIPSWNEYRIPVPYDGYTSTLIRYCPFCGTKLAESLQQKWHETLNTMGYADPGEQKIPDEFNSDVWWRQKNKYVIKEK
jgi:hypothetical protein